VKISAADRKFSKMIRERAGHRCQRCGSEPKPSGLHCAHIFSRAIKRTRHDPDNAIAACNGCHRMIDSRADVKEALARSILGDERYEALRLRAHTPMKRVSVADQSDAPTATPRRRCNAWEAPHKPHVWHDIGTDFLCPGWPGTECGVR